MMPQSWHFEALSTLLTPQIPLGLSNLSQLYFAHWAVVGYFDENYGAFNLTKKYHDSLCSLCTIFKIINLNFDIWMFRNSLKIHQKNFPISLSNIFYSFFNHLVILISILHTYILRLLTNSLPIWHFCTFLAIQSVYHHALSQCSTPVRNLAHQIMLPLWHLISYSNALK